MAQLLPDILLVAGLLLVEGFFSGAEIALISADKLWLRKKFQDGSRRARAAHALSRHPEKILSTTLVMTAACVIVISGIVTEAWERIRPDGSEAVAILIASFLVVVFGELIPKILYRKYANPVSLWVALPIEAAYFILYPLTRLLSTYTHRVSRMVSPVEALVTGKRLTSRDELRLFVESNRRDSEIKTNEKRMIKRIFDFRGTNAKSALLPLVKVDAIDETATVAEAQDEFRRHRHSRIPVYSERIDNITGVLDFLDLLSAKDPKQPIRAFMHRPEYVADQQALPDVLAQLVLSRKELAIVVDEHGGAVGILTTEDIFEEIAGEISDEYDSESLPYRVADDNRWIVQARMEITQINEQIKLFLPDGDYETLAGFLLKQFGRIPQPQDELFFNTPAGMLKFTIRIASDRHVESVLIERVAPPRAERPSES